MTIELTMAAAAIALGLVQMLLTALELRRVHGVAWANTARDTPSGQPDSPLLGRLSRAQANLMETLPFFLGLVLVLEIADATTGTTALASVGFVAARVVYVPLYAFGIPWLRGAVWMLSLVSLAVLAWAALAIGDWAGAVAALGIG